MSSTSVEAVIDAQLAAVETDEERWHADRLTLVGASEVACLFDADPYHSRYELWCRKVGLLPVSTTDDDYLRRMGRRFEPVIAAEYSDLTERPLRDPGRYAIRRMPGHPLVGATIDRDVDTPRPGVLECKLTHVYMLDDWHDGPPLRVELQLQQQMGVTGAAWGSVAVLPYPAPLRWWDYERDDELIAIIVDTIEAFWRNHVEPRIPPDADEHPATRRALRTVHARPTPGLVVQLPPASLALVCGLDVAREMRLKAKDAEVWGNNVLAAMMGDAEVGILPDGRTVRRRVVSVKEHVREAHERVSFVVEKQDKPRRLPGR